MRSDLETGNSGFGNYDLETMRSDLETGNSGFGNYDLETKARDLESMCRKPWVGTYDWETFAGHSATRIFSQYGQVVAKYDQLVPK